MRQLYICSKALPNKLDNTLRPRLIGVLRELKHGISPTENGEYEFQYTVGGKFTEYCLRLPDFPDPNKVYNNHEIAGLLKTWIPVSNSKWFDKLLETAGLAKYDEWEWLKHFGKPNPVHEPWLYDTLPDDTIRYDK